jgi:hypothetical protein
VKESITVAMEMDAQVNTRLIANLLRGLAIDAETNALLARRVVEALLEAKLIDDATQELVTGEYTAIEDTPNSTIPPGMLIGMQVAMIDLPTLYRTGGAWAPWTLPL